MAASISIKSAKANTIAEPIAIKPGWYVLAVLSMLMGFASISTDLYLPAMPLMAQSLVAETGMIELTISGYLIGFSLASCCGGRSATGMGVGLQWLPGWSCSCLVRRAVRWPPVPRF